MEVLRIRQSQALQPLNVVLIILAIGTLAGGFLLLSAAESKIPVDGALEWQSESPLRVLVKLLSLNYQYPTLHAGDFKVYMLGIGAGLACLCIGIAILAGARERVEPIPASPESGVPDSRKKHIAPLLAAQAMFGMYVLWSFASSRWSTASELAVGGSVWLAIHLLWSLGLGYGLNRRAATIVARALVVVSTITAIVAIWYFYGRNPTLRAKFPFGNPIFLSGAMIPGLTLAIHAVAVRAATGVRSKSVPLLLAATGYLIGAALMAWAMKLSDSRGPMLGMAFAVIATTFFLLRGKWKWIPVLAAVAIAAAGAWYIAAAANTASATGRDSTLRFRGFTNAYAWRMFLENPLVGHGQGGFVLHGDAYAVDDVLTDPSALARRTAHAHNEWLEVMADLGTTGLVLVLAALFLTLRAGRDAYRIGEHAAEQASSRFWLPPLMGSLVGLFVDGMSGVGLRVAGVGLSFYTVIGLIWALSGDEHTNLAKRIVARKGGRAVAGLVCVGLGIACLVSMQTDFRAALAAFEAYEKRQSADVDETVRLAEAAQFRLSPQRAMANHYRLADNLIRAAEFYQMRGEDRLRRSQEDPAAGRNLRALAVQDFLTGRERCAAASDQIASLLKKAPRFFNQGYLVSLLNLTLARDPQNAQVREQFLAEARAALELELERQPFSPGLAVDWARHGAREDNVTQVMVILARPLRFHRMMPAYVDLLRRLSSNPTFDEAAQDMFAQLARQPVNPDQGQLDPILEWTPELLRIAATIHFMRGEYEQAAQSLELSTQWYDSKNLAPSVGAASGYAEHAVTQFYANPLAPARAIALAERAKALCPDSLEGRRRRLSIVKNEIVFHLAAGDEKAAADLLRSAADTDVIDLVVNRELALRYLDLCESLLQRRQGDLMRLPPSGVFPRLIQWIQRSIALEPEHGPSHFVAADLELHQGNDVAAAAYLREALRLGVPLGTLRQFVVVASQQLPASSALKQLYQELTQLYLESQAGGGNDPSELVPQIPLPPQAAPPQQQEPESGGPAAPRTESG
ncbi:MAG: O-antigen ligase family protein [Planctomycetota bacterium]|jgi:O-antigen ligase/tetratricopeptide (TPR) repeat protein